MVQAYRLLVNHMMQEFGECYPLHLGVTEAGDGEDGRIKSAIGIGTLLEDGIGDTIRVSLTEDPEFEIPVCKHLVTRYNVVQESTLPEINNLPYDPFQYKRRITKQIANIGSDQVPVVIADLSKLAVIEENNLDAIGYHYAKDIDKWNISDAAADFIFLKQEPAFPLPGTLKVILEHSSWLLAKDKEKSFPIVPAQKYLDNVSLSAHLNFVMIDCYNAGENTISNENDLFKKLRNDATAVICLSSTNQNAVQSIRRKYAELSENKIDNPVVLICDSSHLTTEESLIHYALEAGALLIDGLGDGICLGYHYSDNKTETPYSLLNNVAFGILQATRTRISKTEYISCPSCGRTLFDLQETTAKIRAVTNHLKGVKIAIMGCIVNGPGEMADADFGYVGSGVGKITLYKGKEIVKRNINSEVAVDELIELLKENDAWVDPVN
jgi:(E)-4-hydroxy-3-methylbut-2-enyl-diphosphate synthase